MVAVKNVSAIKHNPMHELKSPAKSSACSSLSSFQNPSSASEEGKEEEPSSPRADLGSERSEQADASIEEALRRASVNSENVFRRNDLIQPMPDEEGKGYGTLIEPELPPILMEDREQ